MKREPLHRAPQRLRRKARARAKRRERYEAQLRETVARVPHKHLAFTRLGRSMLRGARRRGMELEASP